MCDWWKKGGLGVCALIGIGGAGKTAIAERFLQALPGAYPEHPRVAAVPEERAGIAAARRHTVFISYAHVDNKPPKRWLYRLLVHLKPLLRNEDLVVWSDLQMKIGDDWRARIQRQLQDAGVAVLLVSPAFLASELIASEELPALLRRARAEGVKILPVLIAPSVVHRMRFGAEQFTLTSLQSAGSPSQTLSEMPEAEQDRVLAQLAEHILEIVSA